MFQRQAKGAFETTGSEQWPVAMCQWLSAMLLSSCLLPAKDAVGRGAYARLAGGPTTLGAMPTVPPGIG